MHELINQTAVSLLKKNNIEDCTTDELEVLIKRYPYFPVARFLLTAKLKQINSLEYKKESQKTSLYFNDPLWLDFLLNKSTPEGIRPNENFILKKIPFEEANNDEWVVENPRPEIFSWNPPVTEKMIEVALPEIPVNNETELVFEPYHTVDYFASQGIKTSFEVKPNDQLGQQLKSFTEWLKSLKGFPPQHLSGQENMPLEEKVIHLADNSIENRNVVTEAMAEVWLKQGNPEKAIDIYSKLSLLNPSKSSYFAGLIEKLKKN
jgi:hypothetical protein